MTVVVGVGGTSCIRPGQTEWRWECGPGMGYRELGRTRLLWGQEEPSRTERGPWKGSRNAQSAFAFLISLESPKGSVA